MSTAIDRATAVFSGLVDLAAERLGGRAILTNDEFFAPKENLLKPGRGIFLPDKYTERGKWMDGWESRRKRTPGHDWCIIQLGVPGEIQGVDIDTNHFLGNAPQFASLDACTLEGEVTMARLKKATWTEILPPSPLYPGSQNLFTIANVQSWTHVRLHIYPDGGVARLRVYGQVTPRWSEASRGGRVDLAALTNGGRTIACSDMFFSDMRNLIQPGRSRNMGDGWETKRRRGPGFDWLILQLGAIGYIEQIDVYTTHFKGNYPDSCAVEGCEAPGATAVDLVAPDMVWRPLLPQTKLNADAKHVFSDTLNDIGPCTHMRLNIFPDGGVSRLRAWGVRINV